MHAPRLLARFNRVVTNPIQRRWAGVLPSHGIVTHVGRRSGRTYRTPLLCFRRGDRVVFVVGYGLHSDWTRNLLAAGQGELLHRRRRYRMTGIELVEGAAAYPLLPQPIRTVARLFRIDGVVTAAIAPL